MPFEFIRDGVLYQVRSITGGRKTVVEVCEQDTREQPAIEPSDEVQS